MNSQRKIGVFVLMLMISFTVNAEKVYERTNSQGVEEFSDQPGSDAEVIDVKPNVVDVVLPEPVEPRPDSAKPASREQGSVRVVVGEGEEHEGSSSYYDDEERRRDREDRERRVNHEDHENREDREDRERRVSHEDRETHQPRQQHKGAARGAGGHR
ncbi:MAG: hypothetical protein V7699_00890 [Porticoccus sp.]